MTADKKPEEETPMHLITPPSSTQAAQWNSSNKEDRAHLPKVEIETGAISRTKKIRLRDLSQEKEQAQKLRQSIFYDNAASNQEEHEDKTSNYIVIYNGSSK